MLAVNKLNYPLCLLPSSNRFQVKLDVMNFIVHLNRDESSTIDVS